MLVRILSVWIVLAVSFLNAMDARADFVDCNDGEQAALREATTKAHVLLGKALQNVDVPQPNPNYSRWFGSYSIANGNRVKTSLGNLRAHMTVANITYHCRCPAALDQQNVLATVHNPANGITERPYHIYVCRAFFARSDSGFDSKGGTIIHEMTHFDVVNSTRDFCSGQVDCEQKAAQKPADAIRSADSYEYYAESLDNL